MAIINGKEEAAEGMTLYDYLEKNAFNKERVAIEKNGDIVPKAAYSREIINGEDSIEIITFVGGG